MKQWRTLLIVLLAAAVLAGPACSPAKQDAGTDRPTDGEDPAPGTQEPVVVLQGIDPVSLDPAFFGSTPQWSIFGHVYDTLTDMDWETGEIVPKLAESWDQVDDTTWRFKLREGVTFQNGEPFNAEVVKWNLDRLVDPEVGAYKWFFVADADYKESKVVDDYTIDIITNQPSAVVADMLRLTFIVPKDHYSTTSLDELASTPIGCGPYRLVEWKRDNYIKLERWDDYWGDKPDIEEITFRPVPEASTRIAELVTGNADLIVNIPPDQVRLVEISDEAELAGVQGGRVIYIMIDCSFEPFGDVRVRKALNHAVNKRALLDNLFDGQGEVLAGIANSVWKNTDLEPYEYDPDKALALFAEAGYLPDESSVLRNAQGESIKVTLDTPFGRYSRDAEVAQAVGSDLRKIGLEVDVQTCEWSVRRQRQYAGTLPPLSLAGLGGFFNGVGELRWITPTPQYSPRDAEIRWQSDEFVDQYAEMRGTLDQGARKQLCDRLQAMAFDAAPWIFLYRQYDFYGVSTRLADWQPLPDETINLTRVELR